MDLDLAAFRLVAESFIAALHREQKGKRPAPDALALTGALGRAGVEVTIGPPRCHWGALELNIKPTFNTTFNFRERPFRSTPNSSH